MDSIPLAESTFFSASIKSTTLCNFRNFKKNINAYQQSAHRSLGSSPATEGTRRGSLVNQSTATTMLSELEARYTPASQSTKGNQRLVIPRQRSTIKNQGNFLFPSIGSRSGSSLFPSIGPGNSGSLFPSIGNDGDPPRTLPFRSQHYQQQERRRKGLPAL